MTRFRERWRRTNGPGKRQLVLTFLWTLFIPVVILTPLRTSVVYLVFLSQYTVIVGHWSTYQAATPTQGVDDEVAAVPREGA